MERYAVFIIKDGKWSLHFDYGSRRNAANTEKDYLVKAGVRAEVFTKIG